ncbi:MAG: tRNA (adenosine(37)-N6)-dimethylallyltransferase MiaA [Spirochaetales bacterium]|nr:MAG: tRNA (adenosine(37)-N6)-dimethylallyltransferase MiaA [Spirochaetales bacterium]
MSIASNKVLALFGPTACGKTDLLERLFLSNDRSFSRPVVVVSADSVQVYRGLDIGSAKPDERLLSRLPHKLLDIRDPCEQFSVGDFVRLADEACQGIIANGGLPVLSGGTAFYIRAFIMGLPVTPSSDPAVRTAIQEEFARLGADALYAELKRVDPPSASRIAPADHYRIARALEVYRFAGRPLSSYALPETPRARWDTLALAIDRPRAELYDRINARVDAMMAAGLRGEVQSLREAGYKADDPGMRAIGYAEFLSAGLDEGDSVIAARIRLHTRRYAKRQLTFMRGMPGVLWHHPDDIEGLRRDIEEWQRED